MREISCRSRLSSKTQRKIKLTPTSRDHNTRSLQGCNESCNQLWDFCTLETFLIMNKNVVFTASLSYLTLLNISLHLSPYCFALLWEQINSKEACTFFTCLNQC